MEMKKVLRTIVGMGLAFAITFASMPQTASAAGYSVGKLNTGAKPGSTYTAKSYFPGIGYQNMKVRFSSVTKEDAMPFGRYKGMYTKATVNMHVSMPKSTEKKIKNNVVKIIRSSKYRNKRIIGTCLFLDSYTGCIPSDLYQGTGADESNVKRKTFHQKQNRYNAWYTTTTAFDQTTTLVYDSMNDGKYLVGYAGVGKEVTANSSSVTNFANGNAPITSSAFFKKKLKKLSIWTRI
ncbi:hypothetical protein [Butyrivibrio sp. VCD2006]|uniref:hypothetical protein n=1 Tax=Butyrivibrio sp. VCD2006 TaxID=1280664 RepID=UPI0003F505EB|nr:hypothetical protein [Butyrivibrio sp. VCD2006]